MTDLQDATDELFDVITVGETMAAFVSRDDRAKFEAMPAGAESNVAMGMARLGLRTRWVSRLGDDPLGELVASAVAAAGVDVAVEQDARRPTGVMVKHVTASGTRVDYYRSESAARTLHPRDLERTSFARSWHLTGITPALSKSAGDLIRAIIGRQGGVTGRITFDINFRPRLWTDAASANQTLLPLARRADVVFVGNDEAEAIFETSDPEELGSKALPSSSFPKQTRGWPAGPASNLVLRVEVGGSLRFSVMMMLEWPLTSNRDSQLPLNPHSNRKSLTTAVATSAPVHSIKRCRGLGPSPRRLSAGYTPGCKGRAHGTPGHTSFVSLT